MDLWATAMPGQQIQAHSMKSFGTADLQKDIMAVSEYLDESPLAQRGAASSCGFG
jgi:hypothetical protein